MSAMEVEHKVIPRNYWTLESETIIFASTIYAVLSVILVGVIFRFWEPEVCVIVIYIAISLIFLIFIGSQSRRRTKLNKLPSNDILELCYLVKEHSNHGKAGVSGSWQVTYDSFNGNAMERIFLSYISQIIPAHDYFSYMLSEKYIEVSSVTDNGNDIGKNTLSISLSRSALEKIKIYENSASW